MVFVPVPPVATADNYSKLYLEYLSWFSNKDVNGGLGFVDIAGVDGFVVGSICSGQVQDGHSTVCPTACLSLTTTDRRFVGDGRRNTVGGVSRLGVGVDSQEVVQSLGDEAEGVRCGSENPIDTGKDALQSGVTRGKNYRRNKAKREKRKLKATSVSSCAGVWRSARVENQKREEKNCGVFGRGHFSDLPVDDQKALKESYAQRLKAENELRVFKAKQQLELEKAKDLTQLKKRQETHIMRQTEVNKVQVEKAFASLARSGNVPGVVGSVETVVTDGSPSASPVFSGVGSGTISPNSSISLAEIRAIQKESLDRAQEIDKLKRRMNRLLDAMPHLKGHAFADPEAPETVDTGVTVDSDGFPIGEFGDGYDGGIREDGKWHFGQDIY